MREPPDKGENPNTTWSARQSKRSWETMEDMKEDKMEEPSTTANTKASDPRDHCDFRMCSPLQYVPEVPGVQDKLQSNSCLARARCRKKYKIQVLNYLGFDWNSVFAVLRCFTNTQTDW